MSKSADEQATDIVVAILGTEKGLQYLSPQSADDLGAKLATVWTKLFETIHEAEQL